MNQPTRTFPIKPGDLAIIQADFAALDPKQAAEGKAVLALVNYDGGTVLAVLPPMVIPHLRDALNHAKKIHKANVTPAWIVRSAAFLRNVLRRIMPNPLGLIRIRPRELRSIRADLVIPGNWKDSDEGRATIGIQEKDGGSVLILLPDKSMSAFATAAFQVIRNARIQPEPSDGGPVPQVGTNAIEPDGIAMLADPEKALVPKGHEVLELRIGGVALRFHAAREVWINGLRMLEQRAGNG